MKFTKHKHLYLWAVIMAVSLLAFSLVACTNGQSPSESTPHDTDTPIATETDTLPESDDTVEPDFETDTSSENNDTTEPDTETDTDIDTPPSEEVKTNIYPQPMKITYTEPKQRRVPS